MTDSYVEPIKFFAEDYVTTIHGDKKTSEKFSEVKGGGTNEKRVEPIFRRFF